MFSVRTVATPLLRTAARRHVRPVRAPMLRMYSKTVRDPDSETGLFYHRLSDGKWAISLLDRVPKSESSKDVICILNTDSDKPDEFLRQNPDSPTDNAPFWDTLHGVLADCSATDDQLLTEASLRENGWAHLSDNRTESLPGRTTDAQDFFGSVAFTDSTIVPSSYQPNNMHRFCDKHQGPMKLKNEWLAKLRAKLEST